MDRFMSGSQFAVKASLRVGIFLALTIGFPFIVYGLVLATNARSIGGAAGAVAVVAGVFLKPVIILGFLISLLAPCWRRMRSLGLPGVVGLLVPSLFLMDWPYLLIAGAHWGVAFSLGIWKVSLPLFAITALAMLVAMSVALAPPDDGAAAQRFGIVGRVFGLLTILLAAVALVSGGSTLWMMASIWFMSPTGKPGLQLPVTLVYWVIAIKPFVCAAFCVAMAAMTYLSRRESNDHSPGDSGAGSVARPAPSASPGPSRIAFGKR